MKDFAAIDFETANGKPSSICSVGIVLVSGGKIYDKIYRLIRPRPNFYSQWTTQIHGLCAEDTADALRFPEVWAEIHPIIGNMPLVAHNSPFDEGCLRAVHQAYEMEYPEYRFLCTLRASRRLHPFLPNHKLGTVAAHCGYGLTNHHHALADAEACAEIALKVFNGEL